MYLVVPPFKTDKPLVRFKRNFNAKSKTDRSQSVPNRVSRELDKTPQKKKVENEIEGDPYSPYTEKISTYLRDYRDPRARRYFSREPLNSSVIIPATTNRNIKLEPLKTERDASPSFLYESKEGDEQNTTPVKGEHFKTENSVLELTPEPVKKYTRLNWEPRFQNGRKYSSVPPLNFRGIKTSLYQRDFVQHDLKDQVPIHKPDLWNTHRNNFPMDAKTINQEDYIDWKMPPPERAKDPFKLLTTDIPLNTGTTYRAQYVNWGPNAARLLMPAKPGTVITELKFDERTTYKEDFNQRKRDMAPSLDRSILPTAKKEEVLVSSIPFLGQTCYKNSFRPYKIAASEKYIARKHIQDAMIPNAAHKDNFVTSKLRDYADPYNKIYCD